MSWQILDLLQVVEEFMSLNARTHQAPFEVRPTTRRAGVRTLRRITHKARERARELPSTVPNEIWALLDPYGRVLGHFYYEDDARYVAQWRAPALRMATALRDWSSRAPNAYLKDEEMAVLKSRLSGDEEGKSLLHQIGLLRDAMRLGGSMHSGRIPDALPLCDKCNRPVRPHDDMRIIGVASGWPSAGLWENRHFFPNVLCEGSPSRAQYIEGRLRAEQYEYDPESEVMWRAGYKRTLATPEEIILTRDFSEWLRAEP